MINENEEQFENPDVDPGFKGHQDEGLAGREDKRTHNIDANISIKEMRGGKDAEQSEETPPEAQENDAMNYKNDRAQGAFNPKNI
ncbi:hypothetical protein [Pedobacter psychroterrae]|uniref:Uncharacterized protein n=1 Tax=Pedobacter psychroterrae TaxID=2530453 RepID=A0A4V2MKN4_9SPHI|nr:hypothetical protein [Pedobacter psychroterrae]TCC98926.1 hypothetical protein EZ437_17450 [Pedobacter psychroterrae]